MNMFYKIISFPLFIYFISLSASEKSIVKFDGASNNFNSFMNNITTGQSYNFLCHIIKKNPKMMENKFGETIGWLASQANLQKVMTTGMLEHEKEIRDILDTIENKKFDPKKSIGTMLQKELLLKIENKNLTKQIGQKITKIILNFLEKNKIPFSEKVIVKFFPEKEKSEKGIIGWFKTGANKIKKDTLSPMLKWAANTVIDKCIKNKIEWIEFFGKMSEKVYKTNPSIQPSSPKGSVGHSGQSGLS